VTIDGAVRKPGKYQLYENMELSDLIFLAGNPLRSAYMLRAEIAHLNPGKPADITYLNLEDLYTDSQDFVVKQNPGVDIFLK